MEHAARFCRGCGVLVEAWKVSLILNRAVGTGIVASISPHFAISQAMVNSCVAKNL